jgi:hypothetical protein
MKKILLTTLLFGSLFAQDTYYYLLDGKKETLTPISHLTREHSNIEFYKTSRNTTVGVSDQLIVKTKDNTNLDDYINKYNLELIKKLSKNLYLLKTDDKSQTISIANQLSLDENILYSHPNFIKKTIRR